MENTLHIVTGHRDSHTTEIKIDNSTDYKDLSINLKSNSPVMDQTVTIQLSQSKFSDGTRGDVCLEIGNISLFGREVEILKEFLNQKL